jgi:tryptophan synthase alpha chain
VTAAASPGARRIAAAFRRAADDGRTALLAYLLAGFPAEGDDLEAAVAAADAGADLLEVGVPFSDPVADGPTIAEAGRTALAAGAGLGSAVRLVEGLRARGRDVPVLVMSYLNPLIAAGAEPTLGGIRDAGCDGLIVPDLPAGADPRLERLAAAHGLAMAFLVAPNTADDRVDAAINSSTAFVYVVPLLGVTGAREAVAAGAAELLERVRSRAAGRVPVAAGFGLKSPDQVRSLAAAADGLIVGSTLVDALRDGGPDRLGRLVGTLAAATRRP